MTELKELVKELEYHLYNTNNMTHEEEDGVIETLVNVRIKVAHLDDPNPEIW